MTLVRAIHTLHRNPTGRSTVTGECDAAGTYILRACAEVHRPGDIFSIDDREELNELLAEDAIVLAAEADRHRALPAAQLSETAGNQVPDYEKLKHRSPATAVPHESFDYSEFTEGRPM